MGSFALLPFDLWAREVVMQAVLATQPRETMKASSFFVCVALLVAGSAIAPVMGAQAGPAGKPETPAVANARSAKLTELKRQQAANEAEIQRLRAKVKQDADLRVAHARQAKTPQPTDSLSEMGSADQLKMQQMMERKTKLEEEISKIMKEASDASNTLTGNLK